MRDYDVVYDSKSGRYSIIAKDDTDDLWHVYLHDAGDRSKAIELAGAMNRDQRRG